MADANPVSIITETVNEKEQRLWTSGFKHVLVFRQVEGEPELEVCMYVYVCVCVCIYNVSVYT